MPTGIAEERKGPIILALGPGAEGPALLAEAEGLALARERGLACVTVDDGGIIPPEGQERLMRLQDSARSSGASVARVPGIDKVRALAEYAEDRDSPAVVIGGGRRRTRGAAARLMESRRAFSVIVVSPPGAGARASRPSLGPWLVADSSGQLPASLLIVAGATFAGLALASYADYWSAAILYLAAISVASLRLAPGYVLFLAAASAIAWDYLFIPPRFTLTVSRPGDALMLALYFVVSLSAGLSASRLRRSERLLRSERDRVGRLHSLALSLAGAPSAAAALDRGLSALRSDLDCRAIVILAAADGALKPEPESGWEPLDERARRAAELAFRDGAPAGRHTRREDSSGWRFERMDAPRGKLGVVGVMLAQDAGWDESAEACLSAYVSTIAVAVGRDAR